MEVGVQIHQSVIKRQRQSLKRHIRNKSVIGSIKTMVKKIQTAIASKNLSEAQRLLPLTISTIDKAAVKGIIHRNTAARKVSRLTRNVQKPKPASSSKAAAGKAKPAAS
jgi:small subunit ribosomal protein S20